MKRDATIRRMCVAEGCDNMQANLNKTKGGETTYRLLCSTCHKQGKKTKKSYCEHCGFVALHKVQLDIDHIDGNKRNDSEDNLQTLCANCHRLKTHANKEWNNIYV